MIDHIRKSPELNLSIDDGDNFRLLIDSEKSPEDYLILQQDTDKVLKAIDLLSPNYKRIVELRFLEDKTYKELSEELGLSLPNVKVRVLRARQLLAEILDKEG